MNLDMVLDQHQAIVADIYMKVSFFLSVSDVSVS